MADQDMQSTDVGNWSGPEYGGSGDLENLSPLQDTHGALAGGLLKSYPGVQKKVTRDGQPPKRRGPKPDSRPAQTRRQELNRQAQRTHRERKEQYIKALEAEISVLRESYAQDSITKKNTLDQHLLALGEAQTENELLKEILIAHGIDYHSELNHRRSMGQARNSSLPQSDGSRSASYDQISAPLGSHSGVTPPAMPGRQYSNGSQISAPRQSPGIGGFQVHASAGPGITETAVKRDAEIDDMPGIFERDHQLGIDFILALEATCRDHEEYLVRRSVTSPDNPEEAQFSGHALMASCPPPTHISTVPAQMGGLQPTYPLQVPNVPPETLTRLLNLSKQLAGHGHMQDSQVTPIMAIQQLKSHPEYLLLTAEDVRSMIVAVQGRVRCYGFGAVMEDFELHDAVQAIFSAKFDFDQDYEGVSGVVIGEARGDEL